MNIIVFITILVILILMYLHIQQQFKSAKNITVYEIDYTNKKDLHVKCDIKQPIVFYASFLDDEQRKGFLWQEPIFSSSSSTEIHIKNMKKPLVSIGLPFTIALQLLQTSNKYITEDNTTFLKETGMTRHFEKMGDYLRPNFVVKEWFDLCAGNKNSYIPLKYHTHSYKFIYVVSGTVRVKITEIENCSLFHMDESYHVSSFNVWDAEEEWGDEATEISNYIFKEIELTEGWMLFIPNYCLYSVLYLVPDTTIAKFNYDSFMSWMSQIPEKMKNVAKDVQTAATAAADSSIVEGGMKEKRPVMKRLSLPNLPISFSSPSLSMLSHTAPSTPRQEEDINGK